MALKYTSSAFGPESGGGGLQAGAGNGRVSESRSFPSLRPPAPDRRPFVSGIVFSGWICHLAALAVLCAAAGTLQAQSPADHVLLVVNQSSSDSRTLGDYYAAKRGLADRQVCRIRAPNQEAVSRQSFDELILQPVVHCLRSRFLQDQVHYIVTTMGVPLTVEGQTGPNGDLASVDSELALAYQYMVLGSLLTFGKIENPYYAVEGQPKDLVPFDRREKEIYLVTRLTGPSLVDALFLVDKGLETSTRGRFYFDLPFQKATVLGGWASQAAEALRQKGVPVSVEDTSAPVQQVESGLGYCTWNPLGEQQPTPLPQGGGWSPGALALLLDPASLSSFRPTGQDPSALKPGARLIHDGVTGVGGFVDDPTLDGYFRPQILFPAYASGLNLAESFYLSLRYLSWRQVVVGDPLASLQLDGVHKVRKIPPGDCGTDAATELPACFARRRREFLIHKYTTSQEAVDALLQAEALSARGEAAAAMSALDACLTRDPYIADAHLLKARLAEEQGDYRTAFEHFQRTAELGLREADLYLHLARLALEKLDDPEAAAPFAQPLYRGSGMDSPEIAALWGKILLRRGEADQAKAVYRRLVARIDPPPAFALEALGRIYYDEGEWDLAEQFLDRALQARAEAGESEVKAAGSVGEIRQMLGDLRSKRDAESQAAESSQPAEVRPQAVINDRPAAVTSRAPTEYPEKARLNGIQGIVVLRLLIDEQGQMLKADLISGPEVLAKAAMKSVRNWKFSPRLINGRAVPSYLPVSIRFAFKKDGGD